MAFYRLEPWGAPADDERFGNIAAVTWNVNLGKGGKPRSAKDFALCEQPPKPVQTPEEQKSIARTIGRFFGIK